MKSIPSKKKLQIFVLKAAVILVLAPIFSSCASKSSQNALNIYQAQTLSISAGTQIKTKEGIYTAQTDEEWVSMGRYAELEQKYLNILDKNK